MIHAPKRTGRDFEVSAADGVRIRGTRYDGGANRLVLVHSLAMDRGFWNRAIEHLPAEWSIIAFDCRGHGASNKPGGAYAIETFGDDVAAVLDFAGWPSAVIAGASMGGCVTLAFAARHPARAQGLGLFDTTAWYGADAPAAWEKRACAAEQEGIASLIDFQVTRWFTEEFRKTHPDVAKSCVDVFVANDIPAYAATCRMLGRANLTDSLQKFAACQDCRRRRRLRDAHLYGTDAAKPYRRLDSPYRATRAASFARRSAGDHSRRVDRTI